jgi:hypothetical protein
VPPPSSASRVAASPATTASKATAAAPAPQRPQPYVAPAPGLRALDKGLAIAAAVMALAAIGTTLFLVYGIQGITRN